MNLPPEARTLYLEGRGLIRSGQAAAGLAKWAEAAELCARAGADEPLAVILNNIGVTREKLADWTGAEQAYRAALAADRRAEPDGLRVGARLASLGELARRRNDLREAYRCFREAADICQKKMPVATDTATSLSNCGAVLSEMGQLDEAERCHRTALRINRILAPNSVHTARDLNNLGLVCRLRGRFAEALDYYAEAEQINQRIAPGSRDLSTNLNNIGRVYDLVGDVAQALDYFRRALDIQVQIDPQSAPMARRLKNIGSIYHGQRDLKRALEFYQKALELDQKLAPRSRATAADLERVGQILHQQGNFTQALRHFRNCLDIHVANDAEGPLVARNLGNLGVVFTERGEMDEAVRLHEKALAINLKTSQANPKAARDLFNLGEVYRKKGELTRAREYLERALLLAGRSAPGSIQVARSLTCLGQVYDQQGDTQRAMDYYNKAVTITESQTGRISARHSDEEGLFTEHVDTYEAAIDALFRLNRRGEAFSYSERAKGLAMARALGRGFADVPDRPGAVYVQQYRYLQEQLALAQAQVESATETAEGDETSLDVIEAQAALQKAQTDLQKVIALIRDAWPEYADLVMPQSITLEEAKRDLLDEQTGMLSYYVGRQAVYVWAARGREHVGFKVRLPDSVLEHAVSERFNKPLATEGLPTLDQVKVSRLLHQLLVEKAEPVLGGARRVVISPHGPLAQLPFEALLEADPTDGNGEDGNGSTALAARHAPRFMADRFLISYTPTLTVLSELREKYVPPTPQRVGPGRPAVPAAGAGESALAPQPEQATALTPWRPQEKDVLLQTHEVLGTTFSADIVAAQAAAWHDGSPPSGESTAAMGRAFLFAGAASVVMNLWNDRSPTAGRLMEYFRRALATGLDKDLALAEAKRKIRQADPNPAHWAGVVLHGDFKPHLPRPTAFGLQEVFQLERAPAPPPEALPPGGPAAH